LCSCVVVCLFDPAVHIRWLGRHRVCIRALTVASSATTAQGMPPA
jgi:hypothetical protein